MIKILPKAQQPARVINFRAFAFCALSTLLFVVFAYLVFIIAWLGLALCVLLTAFLIALSVKMRCDAVKLFAVVTSILIGVISFSFFVYTVLNWNDNSIDYSLTQQVVGVVESDISASGDRQIILGDVIVSNKAQVGKLIIYVYNSQYEQALESGMVLFLNIRINKYELISSGQVNSYAYRHNLRLSTTLNGAITDYVIDYTSPGFFTRLRDSVLDKLTLAMGYENATVVYGMLTGNSRYIEDRLYSRYSIAGIVHILAVSGLHINMILGILAYLLKKLRVRRAINAAISLSLILFVMAFASFSPSVLRAGIMGIVSIYVYLYGSNRDPLSTLSFAFCIILIVLPLSLFDAGFVFSFACVYCIIIFLPSLTHLFIRLKLPRRLASALALSISVQLGVIPASVYFFNRISMIALLTNLLVLPVITVAFTIIICSLPLAYIGFTLPLQASGLLIVLVSDIARLMSQIHLAQIVVIGTPLTLLCYAFYFIISRFFMLKGKRITTILCIALCFVCVFFSLSRGFMDNTISVVSNGFNTVTIFTKENNAYLIGDFFLTGQMRESLLARRITYLDGIFLTKMTSDLAKRLATLKELYTEFVVYFPAEHYESGVELLENIDTHDFSAMSTELTNGIEAVYDNGKFSGYSYLSTDCNILFVTRKFDYSVLTRISEYDIIRAYNYIYVGKKIYIVDTLAYGNGIYSQARYGDFTLDYKNGVVY